MVEGYFQKFLIETSEIINKHFKDASILEVKHIRKAMDISSKNRSKIIFISRALQKLSNLGYLEYVGRNSPKKFKKNENIPIDALKNMEL
ncbi:MAG: hypothetical protein ACTSUE_19160 [Promethearchaeota archaeon]